MAKQKKRFDKVRASRDGHEFHEAWVARKCLGLLFPKDDFIGLAIEGFGEVDQDEVGAEANEIADAVLYYGQRANLEAAHSVVVVQVKYSKAAELKPFRASDAKKTVGKFATTYRTCKGNPPDKPKAPEVEFSKKEVLREEVKIYRQPDHGCPQTC